MSLGTRSGTASGRGVHFSRPAAVPWWGRDLSYMPALDGVRAFAILGTMAYHGGVLVPNGGFYALDTFFALSGYLITSLLMTEWTRSGSIRLGTFWMRRAKRLLPALFVMLAVVALYGAWLVPSGTYPNLRSDEISSLFYFANWHFIAAGSNYFARSTLNSSPVIHTWSLSIEEQFYVVWPLLVLGLLKLRRSKWVVLVVCGAGTIASAVDMATVYSSVDAGSRAYYGTDTRAQSLLVGATLAVALSIWKDHRRARSDAGLPDAAGSGAVIAPPATKSRQLPLLLIGLAGVVGSGLLWTMLSVNSVIAFRGAFLLAAASTAAVLWSVTCHPTSPLARFLSVGPLRYIGRISYGMYLWHYPLFLYLDHSRTGLTSYPLFGVRFAATLGAAAVSFYLVEQPVRRVGNIFDRRLLTGLPLGAACTAAVVVAASIPATGSSAAVHAATSSAGAGALAARKPMKLLLLGDSMALTLGNGATGSAQLYGGWVQTRASGIANLGSYFSLHVLNHGTPDCGLTAGIFRTQNLPKMQPAAPCDPSDWQAGWPVDWGRMIATDDPQVSVVLDRLEVTDHQVGGRWVHIGEPAYDAGVTAALNEAVGILAARGGRVVFATSPYYSSGEQPNGDPWPEDDPARVDRYNAILRSVAARYPGKVFVLDLNRIVDPAGQFSSTVDGVEVRLSDGIHFTPSGDCFLAPRILPYLYQVAASSRAPARFPATAGSPVPVAPMPSSACSVS